MRFSLPIACFFAAVSLTLAHCGAGGSSTEVSPPPGDAGFGASDADDATAAVSADATGPAEASSPTDASVPLDTTVARRALRFIAVGDTGTGSADQFKVAAAMKAKCDADGCDFVQLMGDNFYDSGVSAASDPQFATKFEQPYALLPVPFWVVLGNHDYGGNGAGTEFGKPDFQVAYAANSTKFKLPARHWHRVEGAAEFFGLDTNEQMFDRAAVQKTSVSAWIAASTSKWKIAIGHHPYLSNGPHGNAGRYDGATFVPIVNGSNVKKFFDDVVCGKVDVYISGHDHNRQYLQDTCGGKTALMVSGAGAKVTALSGTNPTFYQASTLGFIYITVDDGSLTAEFIDANGRSEYTRTIRK